MSDAEHKVKQQFPRAWSSYDYHSQLGRVVAVWKDIATFESLGFAKTRDAAWADAASRLERVKS